MGMVAPRSRIASAFVVNFGAYGSVTQLAQERGVSRQWIYQESDWVERRLEADWRAERSSWQQRVQQLEEEKADLEARLAQAVVLDQEKLTEFTCTGQAIGVSLTEVQILLQVLLPKDTPSRATLGRLTAAAKERSAALLAVLDECSQAQAEQAAVDEIYVTDPVLMVVEPESMCWLSGRLQETATGAAWEKELAPLTAVEQVTRDASNAIGNGVARVNAERAQRGQTPIVEQLDHFHTLREGTRAVGRAEGRARQAMKAWDTLQAAINQRLRHGQAVPIGLYRKVQVAQAKAEQAMAKWEQYEQAWQQVSQALQLTTPEGELNTRERAQTLVTQALAQLPDADFAKPKRMLQQPETYTFLDQVQRKLEALAGPAELKQAAVRTEVLRRRPELLKAEGHAAGILRAMLLVCSVILSKAGEEGVQVAKGVRDIFRNAWRASSLVECLNSVLRMQQARHRKMTQGLLDLKRLYWNCHTFRTGRRRRQTPYQRLGIGLPAGISWWQLLKIPPEQLRAQLSTMKKAG